MTFDLQPDQVALIRCCLEAVDKDLQRQNPGSSQVSASVALEFTRYSIEALLVDLEQQEVGQ